MRKPTQEEIEAAEGKTLPDVIAPDLKVLFCGINPGLYSAAVGCHFAQPSNRFWKALHRAGFTERRFSPSEQFDLLDLGYGLTNFVNRATGRASDLPKEELVEGAEVLERTIRGYRPAFLAVLGLGAYRQTFSPHDARPGRRPRTIGNSGVWLLPNPSGLNAHYLLKDLAVLFRELRLAVEDSPNEEIE